MHDPGCSEVNLIPIQMWGAASSDHTPEKRLASCRNTLGIQRRRPVAPNWETHELFERGFKESIRE